MPFAEPHPDYDTIRGYWVQACDTAVPNGSFLDLVAVLKAYGEPTRHYHNVRHIAQCLRELPPVWSNCRRPHAVSVALIFHDVVYDPTRDDNEERSADWAGRVLAERGAAAGFVEAVSNLILATNHTGLPTEY